MENNQLWTDFKAMLKDIKANSDKVEQNDLPEENILGYKAVSGDKYWQIKVSDIKVSFGDGVNVDSSGLIQIISTESGKLKLLEALNEGK